MFSKHYIFPSDFQVGDIVHASNYKTDSSDLPWLLTQKLAPNQYSGYPVWQFINLSHAQNGLGSSAFKIDKHYYVTRPVYDDFLPLPEREYNLRSFLAGA